MTAPRFKAVVIGGGIGGLSAAYRLKKLAAEKSIPLDIEIVEAAPRLGGVIETTARDGFLLEGGPDCFISEKPAALELIRELGMESECIGTNPIHRRSFVVKNGRLLPVPEGFYLMAPSSMLPFLRSGLLSWRGKLRASLDVVIPARRGQEDESLGSFVRRRLGNEVLTRVAQPMIAGIYAADPDQLSLRATMPRFLDLEAKYGSVIRGLRERASSPQRQASGPRYSLFVSLRSGMQSLVEGLQQQLSDVTIHLRTRATAIRRTTEGRWNIERERGTPISADVIFLALHAPHAASLLSSVSPAIADTLRAIPYGSISTLNFAYRRDQVRHPLDGMGFVVPAIEGKTLIACSFSSQKFEQRAAGEQVLLRAFVNARGNGHAPESITGKVETELRELLEISGSPLFVSEAHYPETMPHYAPGHLGRIDQLEKNLAEWPGLYLLGNAYRGIGLPDVIAYSNARVKEAMMRLEQLVSPAAV